MSHDTVCVRSVSLTRGHSCGSMTVIWAYFGFRHTISSRSWIFQPKHPKPFGPICANAHGARVVESWWPSDGAFTMTAPASLPYFLIPTAHHRFVIFAATPTAADP